MSTPFDYFMHYGRDFFTNQYPKTWCDMSQRASSEFFANNGQSWLTWGDHSTFQID